MLGTMHRISCLTQSPVTLSLKKNLQWGHPRWVYDQGEPSLVFASLSRPIKGSPAIFLAKVRALQRLCWTGYEKNYFLKKKFFRRKCFFKLLLLEKICQLKKSKFSFSSKKKSFFWWKVVQRGIRTWERFSYRAMLPLSHSDCCVYKIMKCSWFSMCQWPSGTALAWDARGPRFSTRVRVEVWKNFNIGKMQC